MLINGNIQPFTTYEYIDDNNNLNMVSIYCYPVKRAGMVDKSMPNDFHIGETHKVRKQNLTGTLDKKLYKRLRNINKNYNNNNQLGSVRGFQVGDDFTISPRYPDEQFTHIV